MLFNFSHGSFARVFGIEVFGDSYERWYWHAFIWPIYRIGRAIRDGIWWVRYRIDPRHRYHMINTRLKPGYCDIDGLMLHGMFSLLRRYVEEEHDGVEALEKWGKELLSGGENEFCREANERQGRRELEVVDLYRWWMETRPALKAEIKSLHEDYQSDSRAPLVEFEDKDHGVAQIVVRDDSDDEKSTRSRLDALEERYDREETEMLHRLINIRGNLWT